MGNYITKILSSICAICRNMSCHSSCCNDDVSVDFENKDGPHDVDKNMRIECCHGCFVFVKNSEVHDKDK